MNRIILTDNAIRVVNVAYVEKLIDATALREITTKIRELPDGLVRCKDCKYWNPNGIGICKLHDIRPTPLMMDDWFCADGVRKEQSDG